jgi:hypothetical protein
MHILSVPRVGYVGCTGAVANSMTMTASIWREANRGLLTEMRQLVSRVERRRDGVGAGLWTGRERLLRYELRLRP